MWDKRKIEKPLAHCPASAIIYLMTTSKTVHNDGWFSVVEETSGSKVTYRVAAGGMYLCGGGSSTLDGAMAFIAAQKGA